MTGDMGIVRRTFVKGALASAAALLAPHVSRAQDWPNRPVRFIVHARGRRRARFHRAARRRIRLARLGQQVFIENRTGGAGGTIGIEAGSSRRTTATIPLANDNIASAPHVLKLSVDYPEGCRAGEPARAPAAGARGAPLVRGEIGGRTGRRGEEMPAWAARPRASARTSTC